MPFFHVHLLFLPCSWMDPDRLRSETTCLAGGQNAGHLPFWWDDHRSPRISNISEQKEILTHIRGSSVGFSQSTCRQISSDVGNRCAVEACRFLNTLLKAMNVGSLRRARQMVYWEKKFPLWTGPCDTIPMVYEPSTPSRMRSHHITSRHELNRNKIIQVRIGAFVGVPHDLPSTQESGESRVRTFSRPCERGSGKNDEYRTKARMAYVVR